MKNLKTFAAFLKNEKLIPYSQDSIALAREMNIPVMKFFKDLTEEQLLHMSMNRNLHFLDSLIDDTALHNAGINLKLWEENKMPGISRNDIEPSDLVLTYALQKKIMLSYLGLYTSITSEAILIMTELENYYTIVQEAAVKVFFYIQKETENQLRQVQEELSNKTKELIRSNSELEQFAYVASHDLQEPLRMINSYIQLLASRYKDQLDQDANDFIDFAVDGSNRMRILINSLLEYSRVNRIKPFEYINVREILSEVLMDMDRSIRENSAIIQYSKLPDIYCDPVLTGLLFQNIIGNAIKFRGAESPVISISAERKGGHHLFAIKDNGIGIRKEYFDKIFVIFQRLNSVDKYPGTGIGLAICKKIVERHGGEIWVTSEPGKGAVFYFTIK